MQVNTVEETYIYNLSSSSNVQFLLAIAKKIDSIFFLLQIIHKNSETCAERSAKCRIKSKLSGRQDLTKEPTSNTRKTLHRRRTSSVSQYYNRVIITLFLKKKSFFLSIRLDESSAPCWSFVYQNSVGRHKSFFFSHPRDGNPMARFVFSLFSFCVKFLKDSSFFLFFSRMFS